MKQALILGLLGLLVVFLAALPAAGQPLYVREEEVPPPPAPEAMEQRRDSEEQRRAESSRPTPSPAPTPTPSPTPTPTPTPPPETDRTVRVTVKDGDLLRNMTLAEYLPGVLSAEMPESFPDEALRAQAVAARSFTLYKMAHPDGNKHPDAAVCTDPNCCKAYLPPPYTERMTGAVRDTDGVAALYGGEPVLAVFHAASGGRTEACADVWGKDVPYLQSVESPGEENSPRYYGRVEMTLDEFTGTFLKYYPDAQFGKSPQGWFTNIRRSEAGGVRELTVGGVTVPGTALRGMFGLQSTNMVITAGAESVVIDTLGHGHGVGLSQYGAAALAEQGKPYDEILKWYYTGVTVAPYAP